MPFMSKCSHTFFAKHCLAAFKLSLPLWCSHRRPHAACASDCTCVQDSASLVTGCAACVLCAGGKGPHGTVSSAAAMGPAASWAHRSVTFSTGCHDCSSCVQLTGCCSSFKCNGHQECCSWSKCNGQHGCVVSAL